eukprot:5110274-Amphidinium_carterae.1
MKLGGCAPTCPTNGHEFFDRLSKRIHAVLVRWTGIMSRRLKKPSSSYRFINPWSLPQLDGARDILLLRVLAR